MQKHRRISLPLKDIFDGILDKWEEMYIIEDVRDEPTEWCSNFVLTPKKEGGNIRAGHDRCQQVHKENLTCHPHIKRAGDKT